MNTNLDTFRVLQHHFKFEATWPIEGNCETVVQKLWNDSVGDVPGRLRQMGIGLDEWYNKVRKERQLSKVDLE